MFAKVGPQRIGVHDVNDFCRKNHCESAAWPKQGDGCQNKGHPRIRVLRETSIEQLKYPFRSTLKFRREILVPNKWRIANDSVKACYSVIQAGQSPRQKIFGADVCGQSRVARGSAGLDGLFAIQLEADKLRSLESINRRCRPKESAITTARLQDRARIELTHPADEKLGQVGRRVIASAQLLGCLVHDKVHVIQAAARSTIA
jgi:hypothetical protein